MKNINGYFVGLLLIILCLDIVFFFGERIYELSDPLFSMLFLTLIILTLIVKNKLTYIGGLILFLLPFMYNFIVPVISSTTPFDFTYLIFTYLKDHSEVGSNTDLIANVLFGLPRFICIGGIVLFLVPKIRRKYWR